MRCRPSILALAILGILLASLAWNIAPLLAEGSTNQSSTAGYSIYRLEFAIETSAYNATFDIGSGVYIYNFSTSPSVVTTSWTPTSFRFSRSSSQEIGLLVVAFMYIPTSISSANVTIVEKLGWSNITIYNYNGEAPVPVESIYDSKLGTFVGTITNVSALTVSGPVFVVDDTLRSHVPKSVFAYYYPWYSPSDWNGAGRNCTGCSSVTGVPKMGFYNSQNTSVIDEQISLAQNSGINGFLIAWGGNDSFSNQATTIVFQEAQKLNFPVTIYYQSKSLLNMTLSNAQARFVSDTEYILKTYGSSPEILRINGVPTIFVFYADSFPASFWGSAIDQIRSVYPRFYIIGDSFNFTYFTVFDGLSDYNVNFNNIFVNTGSGHTNGTLTTYFDLEIEANLHDKLWFAPTETGFDNVNDGLEPLSYWSRQNGLTYKTTWTLAVNSNPDGITITSWNEWHEGTNIEPLNTSMPTPDYWSHPNQYLDITSSEITSFSRSNQSSSTTSSITDITSSEITSFSGSNQSSSTISRLLVTNSNFDSGNASEGSGGSNDSNSSTQSNSNVVFMNLNHIFGLNGAENARVAVVYGALTTSLILLVGMFPIAIYSRRRITKTS